MISESVRVVAAGQVDQVRFNQTKIMLHLLDKLSTVNDHLYLQPVTSLTFQATSKSELRLEQETTSLVKLDFFFMVACYYRTITLNHTIWSLAPGNSILCI